MSSNSRSPLVILVAALAFAAAACTPSAGALGTPATPSATQAASTGAGPSDALPSQEPTVEPSAQASPSVEPSAAGSASPGATSTPGTPPTSKPAAPTAAPTQGSTATMVVRAYFILGSFTDNAGLVPVLRTVPQTQAVARVAMVALLAGPNQAEMSVSPAMYTSIPDGTRLLDISIAGGVATVNLSGEFKAAATTSQQRAANSQVVYTLTQFSSVTRVQIEVGGAAQGGATDRADYRDLLPAIFVDRPAWGAALGNPGRVAGLANVFEATFRVQVMDATDKVLADQQVMASCGTGCWGTFKTDVSYTVAKGQYGTLRVFDLSAKDGTPENVTEYRVWLAPAG